MKFWTTFSSMKFWTTFTMIALSSDFVASLSEPRDGISLDSLQDALKEEAEQMDSVLKHSDIIVGFGHLPNVTEHVTQSPNMSPLLAPSEHKVHHKTRPPALGSLCDYEEYVKVFSAYYEVPFINYAERLYEHKNIEADLGQGRADESNERAWALCQFSGIMMACGESRKCECLHEKPPYRYVAGKVRGTNETSCLGRAGSICSNDPRARLHCEKALKCLEGYCGGLKLAAKTLSDALNASAQLHFSQILIISIILFTLIAMKT